MRTKISAILAVSAATLLLAGCAGTASGSTATSTSSAKSASSACTPPKSGSVSDAVKVTGAKNAEPAVTFTKPLKATSTERSYVTKGDGAEAKKGTMVDVSLVAYNGTSGAKLVSSGYGSDAPVPYSVGDSTLIPGITDAIECAPVGSRLVTTATAKAAWGGADPTQIGLKTTDTVVFVADIVDAVPTKADGAAQPAQAGFPTVKLAASGKPTITIPKDTKPSTETKVEVLKKGTGAAVKSTDGVFIQYQGVNWRTGKVFDQSWGKSLPVQPEAVSGFVKGFQQALIGQTVGSQVLVVIPPAAGYGTAGSSQAGIKGTDTIVFVIDILRTFAAS
ncbi:FKBP-type peptidyl-prolyl cis-trans isomerase [Humibacter sp. RRB41]|uniref:FKBP-type peptidyl-prolyl cis-trans isomerase n=1 Tax=Humibacter sp. RRB41 TaxID=2919946 RepID=UPI001FA946A7|nr:FKBP-type peptidyl-prolyl cis-trans isomerase [Humibacter sp. RRB41]